MSPLKAEEFETIVSETILGVLLFNQAGECVYLNKVAREIMGLNYDFESNNLKISSLFPVKETLNERLLNQDLLASEGLHQDVLVRRTDDILFIANVGVKNIALSGRPKTLLMLQDMTLQKKLQREINNKQFELKRAYSELLEQNQQLKELDQAKTRFIALTTHELKTPLSAMISTSEVLHLNLYDSQEQLEEFIYNIYEQGQHMMNLVNDILDFAKIQSGKMDYYIEQTDIISLLKKQKELFREMADAHKVKIKFAPESDTLLCYFDAIRMNQIISNIVNNAIKFNRPGGVVELGVTSGEKYVCVSIRDSGKGISPEHVERVFNEFETGAIDNHHKGTGLGMPISRKLIRKMGGDLYLKTKLGKGTTFYTDIPLIKVLNEDMYRQRPEDTFDLAAS